MKFYSSLNAWENLLVFLAFDVSCFPQKSLPCSSFSILGGEGDPLRQSIYTHGAKEEYSSEYCIVNTHI